MFALFVTVDTHFEEFQLAADVAYWTVNGCLFVSGSVLESTLRQIGLQRSVFNLYLLLSSFFTVLLKETPCESLLHTSQWSFSGSRSIGTLETKPTEDRQVLLCSQSHIVL